MSRRLLIGLCFWGLLSNDVRADDQISVRSQRLLLIGQGWDGGHPPATHEYLAGVKLVGKLLQHEPNLELITVSADGDWRDGPQLLARADAVVMFVAEGAKWISVDPKRLAAFQELAKRGGGLIALHWATGTKQAEPIEPFVKLFGGCHGGPDRKFQVLDIAPTLPHDPHPILSGVKPFAEPVHEEFYFSLKLIGSDGASVVLDPAKSAIKPLVQITVDQTQYPVGWSWQRPDGGRSFGFTGLHFHDNWKQESYRRLIAQAALWTLKREIPASGLAVKVEAADLTL